MAWRADLFGAAALIWCGSTAVAVAGNQPPSATPFEVSVPLAPTPIDVGGATRLFYEFHLANFATQDLELSEVEVLDGDSGVVLGDYKDAALNPLLYRPGPKSNGADPRRFTGGSIGIVYMETSVPAGREPPKALNWRVSAARTTPPDPNKPLDTMDPIDGSFDVDQRPPISIGFPLQRGDWVAANGPSNTSNHRRTVLNVDGRPRIAQRFAIDWVKLSSDGRLYHGDKAQNANWYGFGTGVLAVADAIVSGSHDGVPENEPSDKRAVPITLDTVAGNYLILDLGDGRFALYAHLQPGSQRVHVGDKVHRGDLIGLLGNTGNSDAPHLHFHICNANSTLGCEGIPYVFDSFNALGKANFDEIIGPKGWKPGPSDRRVTRRHAMPQEDEVVRIP
jgi:Peptidase family M23